MSDLEKIQVELAELLGRANAAPAISRRDMFAASALQGVLAWTPHGTGHFTVAEAQDAARCAVHHADALMAELDKPTGDPGIRVVPEAEQRLRKALADLVEAVGKHSIPYGDAYPNAQKELGLT